MTPQWLWRHDDSTRGPFETREVQDLILSHQVCDADEFQLSGRKDWIPATKVKAMFRYGIAQQLRRRPGTVEESPDSDGSEQQVSAHDSHATQPGIVAAFRTAVADVVSTLAVTPLNWSRARAGDLWRIVGSKAGIAVVVGTCLLLAVAFWNSRSHPAAIVSTSDRERFLEVSATWIALEDQLQQSVSDEQWARFQEQKSRSLEQLILTLERSLEQSPSTGFYWLRNSRDQAIAHRELLAAARHLQRLITSDARAAIPDTPAWINEKRVFGARLIVAHDLLDIGLPDQERLWSQFGRRPLPRDDHVPAMLLPIVLVADMLLLAGGGIYWWRHRRSPERQSIPGESHDASHSST